MLSTIQSLVRHLIGMALGTFVADGIISGDQLETVVSSVTAVVGVVALVGWSYIEKKFISKKAE